MAETPWQDLLHAGRADPDVAARLGGVLAAWHDATAGEVGGRADSREAFERLRIQPNHGAVGERWPRLARAVGAYADQLLGTKVCLVHGDLSPANVLVGDGDVRVSGFDGALVGDPVFDLATLLAELLLTTVHRPDELADYRACGDAFLEGYRADASRALAFDPAYLWGQTGCLVVAGVDGSAPADYLALPERLVARSAGTRLLLRPPVSLDEAWDSARVTPSV